MTGNDLLPATVLKRKAVVYVRQSTPGQVQNNLESRRRQYELVDVARRWGFRDVEVIDDDLGKTASGAVDRPGFERLVSGLCTGKVGAVLCFDASRLSRNGRDWHHLLELCGLVEARVIDLDGVYDPCRPNDRLLLGMKGSISEFELGILRSRMLDAARAKALTPHLIDGALLAMCMDWRGAAALQSALIEACLEQINLCVWVKSNGGMGSLYRSQHELVFIVKHGKASHINNVQLGKFRRYRTNVWRYAGVNTFGRDRMAQLEAHPTPKPIPMVADAIRDVSNRGQIVLDSFMGSGTTLLAAERTARIAYGMDIDPGYIDVCIARWEKMTGREARLAETGQTYAEVKAQRLAPTSLDNESLI